MTEDGHILNCFVRQTILYMTVFGHIRSAFFKSWDEGMRNSKGVYVQRRSCMGHQILYCLMKKNIYFLTTLQLYLCSLYGRILMDVTVLTLEGPCRKLLDSLLSMKRRLSLSLENCVLNSILDARFEMYISFFSILNNFSKDFFPYIWLCRHIPLK